MKLPRDLSGPDLVPAHDPLKVGTLASILRDLSQQTGLERDELLRTLF